MTRSVLLAACLLMLAAEHATARPGEPPLVLAEQGFFYVGGKEADTKTGRRLTDQMYARYQIPEKQTSPYPLVLIHGGGMTGTAYEGTPDGRQGWAEFFLRRGFAVYVVDQPTYGRSPWNEEIDGPMNHAPADYTQRQYTATARFKPWPQAEKHTQSPGGDAPDNPYLAQVAAAMHPNIPTNVRMDEINRDAGTALLDRIGPAILFTHSRSGPFGWLIADARPGKVKAIVAIEPSGPPFRNPPVPNMPQRERTWGPAYAKLTYDPAPASPAEMMPDAQESPRGPDTLGCFPMKGPKRKLVHMTTVPTLIVTGEASFHAQYDHCTVDFLKSVGVPATHMKLEEHGQPGNGHLMMWEANNLAIAELIRDWISATVK